MTAAMIKTTCPYCGVGCGVIAGRNQDGSIEIAGDPAHPANLGRLCTKGMALGETVGLERRLLHPLLRGQSGELETVCWDRALEAAASGLEDIIREHGPNSVAFYLSGQLLTEDYYVANKLMKGFIGSSNVDTNSRLCMASTVAGHKRAFGSDTVPACYEDLDLADLIILVGSNTAWCHPILFQRILNRRANGAKLVVIDTRRTVTADSADLFLEILPGSDQSIFCGLLCYLVSKGAINKDYISKYTTGFEEALHKSQKISESAQATALATGITEAAIAAFFEMFASIEKVVTVFSQGVNQSAQGVDKVNSIINCHLATGRIGKPGCGPFSFTGQPNAMGGREVGGLANMLAAHMGFDPESIDRVQRFWNAPKIAHHEGLKAVQMFDAVARGEIKGLWIAGTNPAASMPNADLIRRSLSKLDLLIISDNVRNNDTIRCGPHILLPALAWGEKNGTVTNSERRISRQRPFLPLPGEARPDWAIFSDVGRRMGFTGFSYDTVADIFREHAALSSFENNGRRDFDLTGLVDLSNESYDQLEATFWPIRSKESAGQSRFFECGGFYTDDRRAKFIPPKDPKLASLVTSEFPLRLNTGRIRDQWHTMTRTGLSPRLSRELFEPFVDINPSDAAKWRLRDNGFTEILTALGSCILRVNITDRQPIGSIFVPIHWTDETSSHARIDALVEPKIDPISGQPEAKATPVTIKNIDYRMQGFLLAKKSVILPKGVWWTHICVDQAIAYSLAGDLDEIAWKEFLNKTAPGGESIIHVDQTQKIIRIAVFIDNNPQYLLSLHPESHGWESVLELFQRDVLTSSQKQALVTNIPIPVTQDDATSKKLRLVVAVQELRQKNHSIEDYIKIVRRQGLISHLSKDILAEIIEKSAEFKLDAGDILFIEGNPGDSVYIVVTGLMQIFTFDALGKEVVLAALAKGELVGEHYLLKNSDGNRSASVRAVEKTTLLRIEGELFRDVLARDLNLVNQLQKRRDQRELENLGKRSEIFKVLISQGAIDPQVHTNYQAGEVIFREGDTADAAWLILSGEAAVYSEGTPHEPLAYLYAGHCFGEQACVDGKPRAASVRAVTDLVAVRISRESFLRLHEISSELREIVSGLQFVYHLPQRGVALQYACEKSGFVAVERIYRLKNGRKFLSSWIPNLQAFKLESITASSADEFQEFKWVEPTDNESSFRRNIKISSIGEIISIASVGEWHEIPQVIEAAIDQVPLNQDNLHTFEKTGLIDIDSSIATSDEKICFCLNVSAKTINSLIERGYTNFQSLREKTGCGSLCGGCEPHIQSMLGHAEWIPVVAEAEDLAQDIRCIKLKPAVRSQIIWKTGQYVVLSGRIDRHWINRSYTITSPPVHGQGLEIAVKRETDGLFSRWLFEGAITEKELRISLPRGHTIWVPSSRPTVCFVAGIGVTPAVAILRGRKCHGEVGNLHIDYSARDRALMAFASEIELASQVNDGVSVEFRFTSTGSRLGFDEIAHTIDRFPDADYFICGPDAYTDSVVAALNDGGVPPHRIFEERFVQAGAPIKKGI